MVDPITVETVILKTIRAGLGILPDFTDFDQELMTAINSALMAVNQLGIGPEEGLIIVNNQTTWAELFDEAINIEAVKSYILLKCKLEFDPPGTSFLLEAVNRQITELAWRLMVEVDPDLVSAE
jgi:hypothetical protein